MRFVNQLGTGGGTLYEPRLSPEIKIYMSRGSGAPNDNSVRLLVTISGSQCEYLGRIIYEFADDIR